MAKTLAAQAPLTGAEEVNAVRSGLMTPTLLAALQAIDDPAEIKALLDAIADTNLLTDAERAAIVANSAKLALLTGNWKLFYTDGAGALTALALGSVGQNLLSGGAAAAPIWGVGFRRVLKTADEQITSDDVLGNDAALIVALEASKTYMIRITVFLKAANATLDLKFATSYSGTTSGDLTSWGRFTAADGTTYPATITQGLVASTNVSPGAAGTSGVQIETVITTNAAGNFAFQWAQRISDAGALTCLKGSFLEYMVIA